MQQQVRLRGLLQSGLKGIDQGVRQISDESHCIGQRNGPA